MNNIFILDGQTDEVLGHINKKYIPSNEHEQDLPATLETFNFTTLGDKRFAEHLGKRNGLIIPGEDGEMLEFRIFESIKYRDNEGLKVDVYSKATYLDLKKSKVFDPHKTTAESAQRHAELALAGTGWQIGEADFKGVRTLEFDNPFNPYDYLKRIAREFELELRFYVTHDGSRITGRYVDLVDRIGEWRGRTIEFGRDLQRIERKENTDDVVTALWVYGPEREDGTRLKVFVEDEEARERWGINGEHLIDYYEPQTDDQNITESRLRTLGEMELRKRINAVVTYEAEILDLENVPGLENKKIRFGDTIRIKDLKFNPALYVEARVFNQKRDVFNKANKTVQLGDYVEYTEEEVKALFRQMQTQIQRKISAVQAEQMIEEYAEPKKVESPTPPPIDSEGDNPIWVDTSQEPYVPHVADTENNEWVRMTLSDEDVLVNDVNYNGLKWSKDEGLIVERSDGKVRSILNGTDGIKVQQKIGSEWVDVYYVDENGNVKFAGHLEGASGTFSGEVVGGSIKSNTNISVTTDLKVGNNIYVGDYDDGHIDKNIIFNEISTIKARDNFMELDSRSIFIYAGDELNISLGGYGYPYQNTYIELADGRIYINSNFGTTLKGSTTIDGFLEINGNIAPQVHSFLSLQNGWQNYGGEYANLAFTKNADGFVHLRGVIRSGQTGNYGCARLPAGSRPFRREIFTVLTNNKIGRIDITPDGWIWMTNVDNTWVSLSGVSFRAEN